MSYEDFDKKVRDAAGQHHPTYDEKAWGKMECLLEKHMPAEKEDRRRFIFFLLFFLLLGGAVLLIVKPWSNLSSIAAKEKTASKNTTAEQDKTSDEIQTGQVLSPDVTTFPNNSPSSDDSSSHNSKILMENENSPQSALSQPVVASKKIRNTQTITQKKNDKPNAITSSEYITSSPALKRKDNQKNKTDVVDNPARFPENNNQQTSIVEAKKDDVAISPNNTVAKKDNIVKTPVPVVENKTTSPLIDPVAKEATILQQNETKKAKSKSDKSNSFFFSLSAGPDVSAAGGEKLGKTKLLTGFVLGYTFNNKLTIRTGFYSGRKVYAASPDEYNPPADFWIYYPYLEKVEADCKVYEIPVSLSYNFGKSTRHNWFASAGLSSYLMKKEVYNYYYKYAPNTPTLNAKWTVLDENKHLFSVITLSGGYQRKLSNSVSLMLEPYIKLPLSGVGYGKVKLNSGGVLMTLSIKPFKKTTKEK